jgi:uncharacterized RDD family membrane protein YckC
MTCQHCQTWILDDDHRCRHCGRRVRSTPARISPNSYPIAATATARAYDFSTDSEPQSDPYPAVVEADGQQAFFKEPIADARVIPFASLTSPAERQSIRARAAEIERPAPVRTEKIQLRHARPAKTRSVDQPRLDFQGHEEPLSRPQSHIICDAPVAPCILRMEAAAFDAALVATAWVFGAAFFTLAGGTIVLDSHSVPFLLLAMSTVPLFYKLLWAFAGTDTPGMRHSGLRLVDFDGNPPTRSDRYERVLGSILSFLAAGIGLVWSFVDEDQLTWHDHISSTFPTVVNER